MARDLQGVIDKDILPALALLPSKMSNKLNAVILQLLTTTLQEDPTASQAQQLSGGRKGPARGVLQFEKGGGVKGVFTHSATKEPLRTALHALGYPFDIDTVYLALETKADVLDFVLGRLLYWADSKPLPAVGDMQGSFEYYVNNWRPGAYTNGGPSDKELLRKKWSKNYAEAMKYIK